MITVLSKETVNIRSRGLIIGSPMTGKTSLLNTINDERVIVLNYPGEPTKSIPIKDNIQAVIFTYDTLPEDATLQDRYMLSMQKYQDVLSVTGKILKGELGEFDIFFGDGVSSFYNTVIDIVTRGRYLQGDVFDTSPNATYSTRLYQPAHTLFSGYIESIYNSTATTAIMTCWERLAIEDANASMQKQKEDIKSGERVWIPALPGQMGVIGPGKFDWCIRTGFTHTMQCDTCQALTRAGRGKDRVDGQHHTLQLMPNSDVQCVGIKGARMRRIPTFIHQEWSHLKGFIS